MRKHHTLLIVACTQAASTNLFAQCPPVPVVDPDPNPYVVMYVSQWNAFPDDGCSDQDALQAAALWFSERHGNGMLIFEKGTYMVGEQTPTGGYFLEGQDAMHFTSCHDFSIVGVEGGEKDGPLTILKYDDCLRYGAFDPGTQQRYLPNATPVSLDKVASIGSAIELENCHGVLISQIAIDGNSDRYILGGRVGDSGIQAEGDGMHVHGCYSIFLKNIWARGCGRDGLLLYSGVTDPHSDHMAITIEKCRLDWNGRCGMAWSGGQDVTATDSYFNSNAIGYVRSDAAAGLDMENEGPEFAPVKQGYFDRCTFAYNHDFGVISDCASSCSRVQNTGTYVFTDCIIVGSETGNALYPNAPSMKFVRCQIYGATSNAFNGAKCLPPNETCCLYDTLAGTHFDACYFSDAYNGEFISVNLRRLFESNHMGAGYFNDCRFNQYGNLMGIWIIGDHTYPYHVQFHGLNTYQNFSCTGGTTNTGMVSLADVFDPYYITYPAWQGTDTHWYLEAWQTAAYENILADPTPAAPCLPHYLDPVFPVPDHMSCWECTDPPFSLEPPLTCEEVRRQPLLPYHDKRRSVQVQTDAQVPMLFPNPASAVVRIAQVATGAQIQVRDLTGRPVLRSQGISENRGALDVSMLPNGTYLVVVTSSEAMRTEKLIVQH